MPRNYTIIVLTSTLNWVKKIIKTVKNRFCPVNDKSNTLSHTIEENDKDQNQTSYKKIGTEKRAGD